MDKCEERLARDSSLDKIRHFVRLEAFRLVSLSTSHPYFAREIFDRKVYNVVQVDRNLLSLLTKLGGSQGSSDRTLGCGVEALLQHEDR